MRYIGSSDHRSASVLLLAVLRRQGWARRSTNSSVALLSPSSTRIPPSPPHGARSKVGAPPRMRPSLPPVHFHRGPHSCERLNTHIPPREVFPSFPLRTLPRWSRLVSLSAERRGGQPSDGRGQPCTCSVLAPPWHLVRTMDGISDSIIRTVEHPTWNSHGLPNSGNNIPMGGRRSCYPSTHVPTVICIYRIRNVVSAQTLQARRSSTVSVRTP